MATSFSISGDRFSALSDAELKKEIGFHTGSDEETSSILRSIRRFGEDVSIRYFEVTPSPRRHSRHPASAFNWSVRAMR